MPILGVVASSKTANLSGTFDLIENAQPSSQGSVVFTGLGAYANSYKHLRIFGTVVDDISNNNTWVNVRFNGDTGNNYFLQRIRGQNSASGATAATDSFDRVSFGASQSNPVGGQTSYPQVFVADIPDFSNTNKWKTTVSVSGQWSMANDQYQLSWWNGIWKSTNAITSVTIFSDSGNWVTGSLFSLYGMK
jgi:hypothetical protein